MAKDFNRKVGGGLFGISMEVEGGSSSRPRAWIEDLLRELACDQCGREYGVYAIGLFCPDCGATNLAVHFSREVELIDRQLDLAQDVEDREMSWRLLGNAHEDVLTALETYLKVVYRFVVDRRYQGEDRARVSSGAKVMLSKTRIGQPSDTRISGSSCSENSMMMNASYSTTTSTPAM
jgi:hypothetical protein